MKNNPTHLCTNLLVGVQEEVLIYLRVCISWQPWSIINKNAQPIVNNSEKSAMKQEEEMVFCFENCSDLMWEKKDQENLLQIQDWKMFETEYFF